MKLKHLLCALIYHALFFLLAFEATAQRDARIDPRPGLYGGPGCGGSTVELSGISSSMMRIRGWQTGTPKPPEDRGAYFHAGTATLLSDGVTWRALARDVDGYCCGNNVESEFRFVSPTRLLSIRYRMWPINSPKPGPNEGWQSVGSECTHVGEVAREPIEDDSVRPPDRPDLIDSGARFSSLSGDIQILHEGDQEAEANYAKMDTIIYLGDKIITGEGSSVIIGFEDMSTFLMKEESALIITEIPYKSKFAIVAGTIWVNVKKVMVNGTIEWDMTQAVAGIKGTKLVFNEKAGKSVTKVIEGSVQVSSKRKRQVVTVNAGFMVTATNAGLGPVTPFNVSSEIDSWESLFPTATQVVKPSAAPISTPKPATAVFLGALDKKAITRPEAEYPATARFLKLAGTVVVDIVVDERGNVEFAEAVSGHPLLGVAAEESARQAKFTPYLKNGRAARVKGTLTYLFRP